MAFQPESQYNNIVPKDDAEKMRTYESLFFYQIGRVMMFGSFENKNSGRCHLQNPDGTHSEIIRDDFNSAFINSVKMLYYLSMPKLNKDLNELILTLFPLDRDNAEAVFNCIMQYAHTTGLFGKQYLTVIRQSRTQILDEAYATVKRSENGN
jgi:hypothetical protein